MGLRRTSFVFCENLLFFGSLASEGPGNRCNEFTSAVGVHARAVNGGMTSGEALIDNPLFESQPQYRGIAEGNPTFT